jgi:hypothetical protein
MFALYLINNKEDIMAKSDFIMFDWTAKRLLRQKSNFAVLKGFLSTLLDEANRSVISDVFGV